MASKSWSILQVTAPQGQATPKVHLLVKATLGLDPDLKRGTEASFPKYKARLDNTIPTQMWLQSTTVPDQMDISNRIRINPLAYQKALFRIGRSTQPDSS